MLSVANYKCRQASSGIEALALLESGEEFELMLTDIMMADLDGLAKWAQGKGLTVTPVMHYVTDVGQFLFAYQNLTDGQELDFTYFWGGRSSCKRSLLVRHGVFCQDFRFGCEDIELGYRLTRHGLTVVYHRRAVQHMNRPVTFDEFCRRREKQGRAQAHFGRLHGADPAIRRYCRQRYGRPVEQVEHEIAGLFVN